MRSRRAELLDQPRAVDERCCDAEDHKVGIDLRRELQSLVGRGGVIDAMTQRHERLAQKGDQVVVERVYDDFAFSHERKFLAPLRSLKVCQFA